MIINGNRQLVTIQKIDKIIKHPNADKLNIATIGLWEIVLNINSQIILVSLSGN